MKKNGKRNYSDDFSCLFDCRFGEPVNGLTRNRQIEGSPLAGFFFYTSILLCKSLVVNELQKPAMRKSLIDNDLHAILSQRLENNSWIIFRTHKSTFVIMN